MTTMYLSDQVRMQALLEDPLYKQWVMRAPIGWDAKDSAFDSVRPWRVYVQRAEWGKWGVKDFKSYNKALKFLLRALELGVWDATISHKVHQFPPPRLRPKAGGRTVPWEGIPDGHRWCTFCRRPTIFRYFTRHHALPMSIIPYVIRCSICGASGRFVKRYR